jgi:hypothetical protein
METERNCSVPCICVFEAGIDAVNSSQVQWRPSHSVASCCVPSLNSPSTECFIEQISVFATSNSSKNN